MKNKKINSSTKQLIRLAGSSVFMTLMIAVCLMTIIVWFFNINLFGWFSFDQTPSNTQINTKTTTGYDIDITLEGDVQDNYNDELGIITLPFKNILAGSGNSQTLTISHKNNENRAVDVSWAFRAPDGTLGKETPVIDNDKYYYLGSQLALTSVKVNGEPVENFEKKFLVTTSALGNGQVTYVTEEIMQFNGLSLIDFVTLPASVTTEVTFTFTFVDNGEDQSAYQKNVLDSQDFQGTCSRILYFTFTESTVV